STLTSIELLRARAIPPTKANRSRRARNAGEPNETASRARRRRSNVAATPASRSRFLVSSCSSGSIGCRVENSRLTFRLRVRLCLAFGALLFERLDGRLDVFDSEDGRDLLNGDALGDDRVVLQRSL